MTNPAASEQINNVRSPYETEIMSGDQLGLPDHIKIHAERFAESVTDLDRAAEIYADFGAVILDSDCVVRMGDKDVRVGDFTRAASEYAIDHLNLHPDIVEEKEYPAYNDTARNLYTVSFSNVTEYVEEVIKLQGALLPTVRKINQDQSTEVSIDSHEGTVINLQLFHKNGDPDEKQEHGAHTDRVDTTTVVCMDNIGPHGELVFVQGYTEVCKRLGLAPHRGFNHNISTILEREPDALTFRIHDVQPGTIVMLRSADDVHFITAKTLGDVQNGLADSPGRDIQKVKDLDMGRGIINMAFETAICREINKKALALESKFPSIAAATNNPARFAALEQALATIDDSQDRAEIANAIVTRFSADDLYKNKKNRKN